MLEGKIILREVSNLCIFTLEDIMIKIRKLIIIILIVILSSCKGSGEIADQSSSLRNVPVKMLISEVFTGVEGNNQADFVEPYNAGTEIADLNGYTLNFQLNNTNDKVVLYHWT